MPQELNKLPPLPPSHDKYWDEADRGVMIMVRPVKCDHEFIHRTASEVICPKCRVGYFIDPQSSVRAGHIYIGELLAI